MDRSNIFVSFSKRRSGLFKKAAELCAKCDARIAVVVLSPKGNPFAFGHSSVDEVLNQYFPDPQQTASTVNKQPRRKGAAEADRYKRQKEQLEGLKARMKHEDSVGIMEWIEREWETRKSAEELEFLKQKYLLLLDLVTTRLAITS